MVAICQVQWNADTLGGMDVVSRYYFFLSICLIAISTLFSSMATEAAPVQVSLVHEKEAVLPGQPFWVGIHIQLEDDWHVYWKNPGDAGMAPAIDWDLPSGFSASSVVWPVPKQLESDPSIIGYGYDGEILLLAQITPPASASGNSVPLHATVHLLACSQSTCMPEEYEVKVDIPVADKDMGLHPQWSPLFIQAREQLPKKIETQACQKNDEIQLPVELDGPVASPRVKFYPENQSTVGPNTRATLVASSEGNSRYTLNLKVHPNKTKEAPLKGVLVVHDARNKDYHQALEIEATIDSESAIPPLLFSELGLALIFAFLGGLILNLMPCVLPVVSLKILSFVQLAGKSRALIFKHGLAFSLGVLISFWVLAGMLLTLQAYGRAVGWGFQLQDPLFVAILAAIVLALGLSLFGVYEVGSAVTAFAGKMQGKTRHQEGLMQSFFSGILATAVATPCTGPFLGSAVGFAMTIPAPAALLVFTFLGLGMSFPYLLFARFPQLLCYIPKPGAWMGVFKEVMGFLMFATVLWLLWVFSAQTGALALVLLLAAFLVLSLGCWILGKWGESTRSRRSRFIGSFAAFLCLLATGYIMVTATSSRISALDGNAYEIADASSHTSSDWEAFSPERVLELRKKGIPVFIDFTAKWCLICQVNHLVLTSTEINAKMDALRVVKMKADWTKNDPVITQELRKFGRSGVPLYVLYGKDFNEAPEILPQVLTTENVLQSLQKLEPTEP